MPASPPTGRQPPPRIELRTRHGPGADGTAGGKEKRRFNLALKTRAATDYRQKGQAERDSHQGPQGRGTCPTPGIHLGTTCEQTDWRDEAKVHYLYTQEECLGTAFSCPDMCVEEKGHSPHENQDLADARGHSPCAGPVGRQRGTPLSPRKMKPRCWSGDERRATGSGGVLQEPCQDTALALEPGGGSSGARLPQFKSQFQLCDLGQRA